MTLRTLGRSDLNITSIGIGAWAIGGGQWEFAWGAQDDTESIAAIHAGFDCEINRIDTAPPTGWVTPRLLSAVRSKGSPSAPISSPSAAWSGAKMNPEDLAQLKGCIYSA